MSFAWIGQCKPASMPVHDDGFLMDFENSISHRAEPVPPYEARIRGTSQVRCGIPEELPEGIGISSAALPRLQERATVRADSQAAKGMADRFPWLCPCPIPEATLKADRRTPAPRDRVCPSACAEHGSAPYFSEHPSASFAGKRRGYASFKLSPPFQEEGKNRMRVITPVPVADLCPRLRLIQAVTAIHGGSTISRAVAELKSRLWSERSYQKANNKNNQLMRRIRPPRPSAERGEIPNEVGEGS
jgi:hypothetical protein